MKKIIFLAFIIFSINSCKNEKPIFIKEIISDETVTITPNLKRLPSKDSVSINIPAEFEIKIDNSLLKSIDLYYVINRKVLMQISEYEMYNKQDKTKPINSLESYLSSKKPLSIIIRERNHLISKNDAEKLLKKYNINQSLENFKLGDTIKLVPYNQFRRDNPKFLNELRKIGDTIIITSRGEGENIYKPIKTKINW